MTWDFPTLFRNIATIVFETFRNKLQQRHSVNLVKLSKYLVYMFQCFNVSLKQMDGLGFLRGFYAIYDSEL